MPNIIDTMHANPAVDTDWHVVPTILTDNSVVHDVVANVDGAIVSFNCTSEGTARALADMLNNDAFVVGCEVEAA